MSAPAFGPHLDGTKVEGTLGPPAAPVPTPGELRARAVAVQDGQGSDPTSVRRHLARLAKHVAIYGLGGVLNRLIGFLLLPLFTAYLTPTEYGINSLLGMLGFVLTAVFSLGLGTAIGMCYFEGDDPARKATTIGTAAGLLGLSALTLGVLGSAFAAPISRLAFDTSTHHDLVALSVATVSLSLAAIPFGLYLQFEERAIASQAVALATTVAAFGLSIVTVVILRQGIWGLVGSVFLAQGLSLVLLLLVTLPRLRLRMSRALGLELLRLGLPMIPSVAFVMIIYHGTNYVLRWFHGLETVGVYGVGFALGGALALVVNGFQQAWMPYFMPFKERPGEARVLFGRILTYYAFGCGGLSLLFYVAAKPVVMIMTQPAYHEAYKIVGAAATSQFLAGVFWVLLPAMYFAKEARFQTLVQGVAAVLAVAFNLLLIPLFGLVGAGMALVLGVLSMAALQHAWNMLRRRAYLRVEYEWRRLLAFVLLYAGVMALTLTDRGLPLSTEAALSVVGLVAIPLVLYRLLTPAERAALRTMVGEVRPARASAYADSGGDRPVSRRA